jgi:hypothetical protein
VTVVRVREQGALGRTISFAADPQPTFAAEFCCVLSREGVRKKLCNSDQAHFTPESGHGRREEECPLCAKRWGNRPAFLWIAEDLGCCASG